MRNIGLLITTALLASLLLFVGGCSGDVIEVNYDPIEPEIETPSEPTDPGISWSAESLKVVYGSEYASPTLSNPNGVSVEYSSTDEEVATISQVGVLTIIASGSATIIASSPATDRFTASSASFALTVERADGGLEWSGKKCETIYGEEVSLPVLSNPNELEINWFSSDETVATISGNGEVTIIGAGSAMISASSVETSRYNSCEVSYELVVGRAPSGLEFSGTNVTAVIGQETIAFPTLSNPNELVINWFSSDENVAAVSGNGVVTIIGAGSAIISASSAETAGFEAGNVSFTVSVGKNNCEVAWPITTCNVKIGEENVFPVLDNPAGQEISYSSSDETVAGVSPDGVVILRSPGSVTITATASENGTHLGGSVFYTLNVEAQDIRLQDPELKWSAEKVETQYGRTPEFPSLSNPNNLSITYSSSSPDVATISSNGNILVRDIGTTTITASSKATDTFAAGSVSYVISVSRAVPELSWSDETCEAALDSDNDFPTLDNPDGLGISYSSSNPSVANISSDGVITLKTSGTTSITATTESSKYYETASAMYVLEVTKARPPIGWSESSFVAVLGSDSSFPVLDNPLGISISYSSSNSSVATISQDGTISIIKAGTTTINAATKESDEYSSYLVSYKLTVKKNPVALSWSAANCSASLNESNSYPTLDNPLGVALTYSSSNTSVATISSGGSITLIGKGSTTITAKFAGDDFHETATASYTLKVVKSTHDEGLGNYTFASTGDPSSDDDVSNTTFGRMITITFKESGSARVDGDYYDMVSVDGNKVTARNSQNNEFIIYKLSGSTSNGYFKLYSEKKQAILLNGVSITNPEGAAINNQSDKRTFIMVEGNNTLSDKSSASFNSGEEDMKSVLFSEGQLVFSGSGKLTVNATNKLGKSAIVSDDYIRFMDNPTIKVTAQKDAGHGIKGNDYVQISSGDLTVSTAANTRKGIVSDGYVLVEGGETTINVTGGVWRDGRDYTGTAGIKADGYFAMTGGIVDITNSGSGGKGIKAERGESLISGGTITITTTGSKVNDVASKGIKIGYEERERGYGNLKITGGTIDVNTKTGEALEVKGELTISGGEHCFYSEGDDAINSLNGIQITGGYISAISAGNDAIDSNSDLRISGGMVYAACLKGPPEGALDAMLEEGRRVCIENGATVVAFGGVEPGAVFNQSTYKMNVSSGKVNALLDNNGKTLAVFKAPENARLMVVSAPGLSGGLLVITASGGSSRCQGNLLFPASISGGEEALLTPYIPTSIWDKPNER